MSTRPLKHRTGRPSPDKPRKKTAKDRTINLVNPVADQYETFIVGNAIAWQVKAMVQLEQILPPEIYAELETEFMAHGPGLAFAESALFHDYVAPFAARYVVQPDSRTGKSVVICGAGPSLAEHAAEYCPHADEVWGCNSAATWLYESGHRVTHGFTVDQTPHMAAEWASAPPIEYLLATTVHPHLVDLLTQAERNWTFFHNFVGIPKPPVSWDVGDETYTAEYEDWLYQLLYPSTMRSGSGLNAVTRAIDVATLMGFESITVLGADCSLKVIGEPRTDLQTGSPEHLQWLRECTVMHANGGHALASEASCVTLGGEIDGRFWLTKADMVITAQWLMRMAKASNGRIRLIGDTLPNALTGKAEEFLARLPNFVDARGRAMEMAI